MRAWGLRQETISLIGRLPATARSCSGPSLTRKMSIAVNGTPLLVSASRARAQPLQPRRS